MTLLEIDNLHIGYPTDHGTVELIRTSFPAACASA
jgi:hypothetical protein